MITSHIATVMAFANKFGDYTGAIFDEVTKEVVKERFETFDAARNFVRMAASARYGAIKFAPIRRKGQYYANVWD